MVSSNEFRKDMPSIRIPSRLLDNSVSYDGDLPK